MAALLASVFVLYSLVILLSADFNRDNAGSPLFSNQERISDIRTPHCLSPLASCGTSSRERNKYKSRGDSVKFRSRNLLEILLRRVPI